MNWTLALPEIVLACIGMAILVFGVLRKQDSTAAVHDAHHRRLPDRRPAGADPAPPASAITASSWPTRSARSTRSSSCPARRCRRSWRWTGTAQQGIARFEFPVLMLFSTVGMMIMASASNLMTLYLGLELQSLALYVLAALRPRRSAVLRSRAEVFRAQRPGLRPAAVWHFAGLRLLRHDGLRCAARPAGAAGRARRRAWWSASCSCWSGWRSRSPRCRSTCGRRMSMRARRRR